MEPTQPSPPYPPAEEQSDQVDLAYYLGLLYRHRVFLVTFFLITVTLGLIFLMKLPDQYKATAQVLIEVAPVSTGAQEELQPTYQTYTYVDTQAEIIQSVPNLTLVAEKEGLIEFFHADDLNDAVDILEKKLRVKAVRGTQLINITIKTSDPDKSVSIVNLLAETYIQQSIQNRLFFSKEILNLLPEGKTGESLKQMSPFEQLKQLDDEKFAASLPSVRTDTTIMQLKDQIAKSEVELFELQRQYREGHPDVVKIQANLNFLKESVDAQTKRVIHELKVALTKRLQVSDARVVQVAEPATKPSGPKRGLLLIILVLLELFASAGLIVIVDQIDDRIKNQDDVEKFVRLPYLGHTPVLSPEAIADKQKRNFYSAIEPQSDLAEALRYIRVGINFSAPPDLLRAFAISSSVPQEGKSFCSCNLAASFAVDGNRVLLVDGDNRRPVLHTIFNMDNANGLTNYLTSNVALESVIRHTEVPGLDLVPSGPVSPNPSELLGSARMAEFLQQAKSQYDRVIVDAPPMIGIGDSLVLGKLIGHLILVVRSHKISRKVMRQVRERLQFHQIKVLGVILNYLNLEKDRYGYYRYHYNTYNRYYGKKQKKQAERRKKPD